MRGLITALGIFGIVGWLIIMTGLRWLSEQCHGYGKRKNPNKSIPQQSSLITPKGKVRIIAASYPRPGRRFEREKEPEGM